MDERALLEKLKTEQDAKARWNLLQEAPAEIRALPDVKSAELWWHARYSAVNKKRTRFQDKFVWLIVFSANWNISGERQTAREIKKLYEHTLLTLEMEAAMRSGDRLYEQFYEAAGLYAESLREARPILGLIPAQDKTQDARFRRIGRSAVLRAIYPFAAYVPDRPYADIIIKALFQAFLDTYPGIRPAMLAAVEELKGEECKKFIFRCVLGDELRDQYDGSSI